MDGCDRRRDQCMKDVAHYQGPRPPECIGEYRACQAECRSPRPPQPPPQCATAKVGDRCPEGQCSCGAKMGCYDKHCACEPGFVACGPSCVDVVSNADRCGACDVKCSSGQRCVQGRCLAKADHPKPPAASKVGDKFNVTPGACTKYSSEYESHPVLSANSDLLFQACGNGGDGQLVSWANVEKPTVWTSAATVKGGTWTKEVPPELGFAPPQCGPKEPNKPVSNNCPLNSNGDVWATTSGYSHLEYIAARTTWDFPCYKGAKNCRPDKHHTYGDFYIGNSAAGMVAFGASDLRAGKKLPDAEWSVPLDVADDGLTSAFDQGGTSLWITANCSGDTNVEGHPCTFLFPDCNGRPDTANCRRATFGPGKQAYVDAMTAPIDKVRSHVGHSTVVVNPCTHHALVGFVEEDAGKHRHPTVEAIARDGTIVNTWQNEDVGPGSDPKCPGKIGTSLTKAQKQLARAQMDVKVVGQGSNARCILYVGWDSTCWTSDTVLSRAATLGSIDVTEEKGSTIKRLTQVDHPGESMDATPVAARFGDSVALIYLQRNHEGTTQTLRARVSRDPELKTFDDLEVSDANPEGANFGDNLSELLGGLPGDRILATWPNVTSSSCETIRGAVITVGARTGASK